MLRHLMIMLIYVILSIGFGIIEIGLFIQVFLNLGLGYSIARQRGCEFRWRADALKIVWATGTALALAVMVVLASVLTLGPLIGLINAVFNIPYIIFKVHRMFPQGGRTVKPGFIEDVKDLIDERKDALDLLD